VDRRVDRQRAEQFLNCCRTTNSPVSRPSRLSLRRKTKLIRRHFHFIKVRCLSVCLFLAHPFPCLFLSPSLFLFLYLTLTLSVCLSPSHSLSLSSLIFPTLCLFISVSVSLSLYLSLLNSLSFIPSLSFSLSLSLSPSLSVCVYIYISLSLFCSFYLSVCLAGLIFSFLCRIAESANETSSD